MVPISSSRTVTAQRPGTEAMISKIHRQSTVGMPTTARATMPPSGDEDPLPERWAYALPARPSSAPAEARADPHTVDRRCREARMSRACLQTPGRLSFHPACTLCSDLYDVRHQLFSRL